MEVRKGGRKRKKKQRKGRKWEGRKEGTEEERKEKGEMNQYFECEGICEHQGKCVLPTQNGNDGPTELSFIAWFNIYKDLVVASFIHLASE